MRLSDGHGSVTVEMVDGQGLLTALEGDGSADLSRIVGQAREWLRSQGATACFAHVDIANERLQELYRRRWGMEPVAVILRTEV